MISIFVIGFTLAVFAFSFWGYPLDGVNFTTLQVLLPNEELSVVDPATGKFNFELQYNSAGLARVFFYLVYMMPLVVEEKLLFLNALNVLLQVLNVGLFSYVLRKLVGPSRLFPYLFLYLLYPFAAANHYWGADLIVNLTATLFLISLSLFLNVEYDPRRLAKNIILRIVPSLLFLWFSIITVEYAICLSPLYVYLALYHTNGRSNLLRFPRILTPYSAIAGLFLLTSVVPAIIFTGHRLTLASYGNRFAELAAKANLPESIIALLVMVGNGVLVLTSYLFANSVGVLLYPLVDLVNYAGYLEAQSLASTALIAFLAGGLMWLTSYSGEGVAAPDRRFLMLLGGLWAALAYFPFLLTIGYPRNVGLIEDRINVLGSMGVVLCLGTLMQWIQERTCRRYALAPMLNSVVTSFLAVLLLLNLQLQKVHYVEANWKERAIVDAVSIAREEFLERGREPIFLLHRRVREAFPRSQLLQALDAKSGWDRVVRLGAFMLERHFTRTTSSTNFHFNGIFLFLCCPSSASESFNFYSDWLGYPRPVVYKWEEPFRIKEETKRYVIGYAATAAWNAPSYVGQFQILPYPKDLYQVIPMAPNESVTLSGFQSYPKDLYQVIVMQIEESTFRLGGTLAYSFEHYQMPDDRQ